MGMNIGYLTAGRGSESDECMNLSMRVNHF